MRPDQISKIVAMRDSFIADPGCDPDIEGIEAIVGFRDDEEQRILSSWFDMTVEQLSGGERIEVFRHLTVDDFDRVVVEAENGTAEFGDHWSGDPDTWSHYADAIGTNIRVCATIAVEQIDWLTTLQRRCAFPAEREVAFEGPVEIQAIKDLDNSNIWMSPSASHLHFR